MKKINLKITKSEETQKAEQRKEMREAKRRILAREQQIAQECQDNAY